ncbi:MAG: M3 family oligoendopeptidase [Bacteroidota bacterium]
MRQSFLPPSLIIQKPEDILPFYQQLLNRTIQSASEFQEFLLDVSDLESAVSEDMAWRYIRMTCDTANKDHEQAYLTFVQEIQPQLAPLEDSLNQQIINCPFVSELENENDAFKIYFRNLRGAVELFREENIALQTEVQTLAQEYSAIQGSMQIDWNGKQITLQQASNLLLETDREIRKQVWETITAARLSRASELEELFSKQVKLRHQIAVNAGFTNYRDYTFKSLGRYDYSVEHCKQFHNSVEQVVVPMLRKITQRRKEAMQLEALMPWDMAVDPLGRKPLKPFTDGTELLQKGLDCLREIRPYFAQCLETMKNNGLLDLESRLGKAPGGYNYPLAKTNMPFIFMNASGNLRDVETLVHEAGHAIHSFRMAPLALNAFKNTPSEVAELASMSMELLSMDGWHHYFQDEHDLKRAKEEQLEGIIGTLPWIAQVDAFQHWIYENPNHSIDDRQQEWMNLNRKFGTGMVDYSKFPGVLESSWHKQLHVFELPFYYIEYGIAQLGSIGIWKNYLENRELALDQYEAFLKLGYQVSIPEIYNTGGVDFNFTQDYIESLMGAVLLELDK